jgi:hypothetical protein
MNFISGFTSWPVETLMGVIALAALSLSTFAIYVVFRVVMDKTK